MNGQTYLADVKKRFQEAKSQADRAISQIPRESWTFRLDPESNSIVTLMLHLAGNMISRWTDFLTADGEKPDRNRDAEFEDLETFSPEVLLTRWEKGWACLFAAVDGLGEADLDRVVLVRSQPLTVVEALNRQLAHYSYHVGQMVFLAKHLTNGGWQTLSVPRRGSEAFNAEMKAKHEKG